MLGLGAVAGGIRRSHRPPQHGSHCAGEYGLVPEPVPTDPAELTDAVLMHHPERLAQAGQEWLVRQLMHLLWSSASPARTGPPYYARSPVSKAWSSLARCLGSPGAAAWPSP
ncbi:hypothetical protein GCM10010532_041820 [Dactylosporangium siamense]|uniref:Uncharacterized protein n=1 Tax=Dactylosporangium siamense TaxID=685454 RepID=A0A919PJC4_9ACTN|nr:hypothetical protein Dsi01nite_030400 [Dactylosporangium siamense]